MFNSRKVLTLVMIILIVGLSIIPTMGVIGGKKYVPEHLAWKSNLGDDNDTTPPVTNHSINGTIHNGIYNTPIFVTLNATDDESGVNVTYYDAPSSGGLKEYKEPFTIAMTGDFNFVYYSVDNAGNEEEVRFSPDLQMDLVPPEVGIQWEKVIGPMGMKLFATCDDYGSGPDFVEFYDDGELMFTDYEEPYEWNWTATTSGKHTLRAVVYDVAGHNGYDEIEMETPFPGINIIGVISNPEISAEEVSFFAIIVFGSWEGELMWRYSALRTITFSYYYEGYIGRHFVAAKFWGMEY